MSRTGELVISLQGQVETLTAAVRTLARQVPAPLVSVHEAAERLGVSVNTVRRRVKSGEIPCTRIELRQGARSLARPHAEVKHHHRAPDFPLVVREERVPTAKHNNSIGAGT
jgi:excisionase family DNA binding protein